MYFLLTAATKYLQATGGVHPLIMPEVTHLATMQALLPTVTPRPTVGATSGPLTTTTLPPWEEAHTILIVIIFSFVSFLLLLAFFYTFYFHCSISSSPKDSQAANTCNQEREDATYRCSSSDDQSMVNVV